MAASSSVVVDATLFSLDEINEAGGVLGRPIKYVVADGQSDWPTFAREAERLITEEQVCTIFGCWASAGRKMVKPVVESHDHLLLYPVQYEGLETSPAIVYFGAAPNQQIIPAVEWAVKSLHKKRFFLIGSDYVFPRAANAIIKDYLKELGGEVVGEQYIPLGSSSTDAVIAAIVKAKPDMILNTINGDSNITFFRDLRAAGIRSATTPTLSFSISEQSLRNLGASILTGDYSAYTYFQSIDTPANRAFLERFHARYPQRAVTDPMESAYVSVKMSGAGGQRCSESRSEKDSPSLAQPAFRWSRRPRAHRRGHAAFLSDAADRPGATGRSVPNCLGRPATGSAEPVPALPLGRGLASVSARSVRRLGQSLGRAAQ